MASEVVIRILGDAKQFHGVMGGVEGRLGGMGKLASGLKVGVIAVGALGAASVKTAASFEQSLNIFQAASGASGEEMVKVAALARALGADMTLPATSSTDAASAMTELAKAGLSLNDVMGASKGVLQLAAAGHLSEGDAARIAAGALNAFGLSGDQAVRVADLLAGAANASAAEVGDLGLGMAQAAGVFHSAGFSVEDLVTSLAIFANNGVIGTDAATSLKTAILRLSNPTKEAQKSLSQLGIDVYDANGNMRPFVDIIGQFTKATAGMSQEARDAAIGEIFGSDAVRAANFIFTKGAPAFEAMRAKITQQGAAAKFAEARTKGLAGAFDALKSQASTVGEQIGTPMLGGITRFTQQATVALGEFGSMVEQQGLGGALQTLGAGMLSVLGESLAQAGAWIVNVGAPALAAQLGTWAAAFAAWVPGALVSLLGALGGLLVSLGTWIVTVGLPALAGQLAQWAGAFAAWVPGAIVQLLGALAALAIRVAAWFAIDLWPQVLPALGQFALLLVQWWAGLPARIVSALINIGEALAPLGVKMVQGIIKGIKSAAGSVGKALADTIPGPLKGLVKQVPGLGQALDALPGFQHGGLVPGRAGQAMPILAHGGEMILNRQQQRALALQMSGASGGSTVNNFNVVARPRIDDIERTAQERARLRNVTRV